MVWHLCSAMRLVGCNCGGWPRCEFNKCGFEERRRRRWGGQSTPFHHTTKRRRLFSLPLTFGSFSPPSALRAALNTSSLFTSFFAHQPKGDLDNVGSDERSYFSPSNSNSTTLLASPPILCGCDCGGRLRVIRAAKGNNDYSNNCCLTHSHLVISRRRSRRSIDEDSLLSPRISYVAFLLYFFPIIFSMCVGEGLC